MNTSLYSIIFVSIIISTLVLFNTIINDWLNHSIIENQLFDFLTKIELIKSFSDYNFEYNFSKPMNLTINEYINFSNKEINVFSLNENNLPNLNFINKESIIIKRVNGEWNII